MSDLSEIETVEDAINEIMESLHGCEIYEWINDDVKDLTIHQKINHFINEKLTSLKKYIAESVLDNEWWNIGDIKTEIERDKKAFEILYKLQSSENKRKILKLCKEEGLIK